MIEIRADGGCVKVVGYQHENDRALVRFPLDDVRDMSITNPGGTYTLAYKRMFDTQFYTSSDIEVDGDYLIWTVGSHALAVKGDVEVQISYSTSDTISETQIFRFKVSRSIMEGTAGQGENLSDLIEAAITAAGGVAEEISAAEETLDAAVTAAETAQGKAEDAQEAAETAQGKAEDAQEAAEAAVGAYNNMTVSITTLPAGSQATASMDHSGAAPELQLGIPVGADGAQGVGISGITFNADYTLTITLSNGNSYTTNSIRGAQGETGQDGAQGVGIYSIAKTGTSGLVDTYTITLTNNQTATFTVTNGQDGNAVIDDTAGVGDTTKVWSADKSASKVSELNSAINSAPTEATGQEMLEAERVNTVLEGVVLDEIMALIDALPSDETLNDIYVGIRTENEWLDVIHREVAARLEETA